jgi:small subunit ribosomal protein S14
MDKNPADGRALRGRAEAGRAAAQLGQDRIRNRCEVTGRPRATIASSRCRRIALRELGSKGLIPGLVKSSW